MIRSQERRPSSIAAAKRSYAPRTRQGNKTERSASYLQTGHLRLPPLQLEGSARPAANIAAAAALCELLSLMRTGRARSGGGGAGEANVNVGPARSHWRREEEGGGREGSRGREKKSMGEGATSDGIFPLFPSCFFLLPLPRFSWLRFSRPRPE
jgi:hypothetical protein